MLIELRIDSEKQKLKSIMNAVRRNCKVRGNKIHKVPHMTLYGPFSVRRGQLDAIKGAISSAANKYKSLSFSIEDFDWFEGQYGKVIQFKIIPSEELNDFRYDVSQKLLQIAPNTRSWDREKDFIFHVTLAYMLSDGEFKRIWSYLHGKKSLLATIASKLGIVRSKSSNRIKISLSVDATRVTILSRKSKIICEYDLMHKKFLKRKQVLDEIRR